MKGNEEVYRKILQSQEINHNEKNNLFKKLRKIQNNNNNDNYNNSIIIDENFV